MDKVIVIDVDDVISVHKNRDYENAIPQQDMIWKMQALHERDGIQFKLFTSRGQKSCNGDIELIEKNNRATLEKWLDKHKVPYAELIFGKPLGDLYVDDKAMSSREFMNTKFKHLSGGSGEGVYKFSDYIKKECTNAYDQGQWFAAADSYGYKVPKVISHLYDKIYLEYIKGYSFPYYVTQQDLNNIFGICLSFSNIDDEDKYIFDYEKFKSYLKLNDLDDTIHKHVLNAEEFIRQFEIIDAIPESFCHGDLTFSNIIKKEDTSEIYMIDPKADASMSSYVLDLAQIRKSLNGFERLNHKYMTIEHTDLYKKMLTEYDNMLEHVCVRPNIDTLNFVKQLEYIYWVRLWRYRDEESREIISDKLDELLEELI